MYADHHKIYYILCQGMELCRPSLQARLDFLSLYRNPILHDYKRDPFPWNLFSHNAPNPATKEKDETKGVLGRGLQ